MQARLPEWVDPLALVDRRARLAGEIPLARLERLAGLLCDTEGSLQAEMDFGRFEERRPGVRGKVKGRLHMTCQRCLEAVEIPVDLDFELYLVESAALAERLPDGLEPLLHERGQVSPREVVEDEVLLALPLVPRHARGQCRPPRGGEATASDVEAERPRPFAVLERLRRQ